MLARRRQFGSGPLFADLWIYRGAAGILAPSMALALRTGLRPFKIAPGDFSVRPIHGPHPSLRSWPALRLSKIVPDDFVNPLRGYHFSACNQQKSPHKAGIFVWWRRGESNPRPKALRARRYMLSPAFSLVPKQHAGQSAPRNQPALFSWAPTGGSDQRSRDNDPTSTSTSTSGFGARP